MHQEQNSLPDPDAAGADAPDAEPGNLPAGAAEPARSKRRSRRSTAAPTRLKQAAELLHTAPAAPAAPAASGRSDARDQRHPGQVSKQGTAVSGPATNPNPAAGTASGRSRTGILLPAAKEDDPRAWGDTPEDTSAWLQEQRPPHWG